MLNSTEKKVCSLLTIIQFTQILDFVVLIPLGSMLMRHFHMSTAEFGLLVSAYNISAAIVGILAGAWLDYFPRKNILIFIYFLFALATLGCGLATTTLQLMMARILAGACGGILNSLVYAYIPDTVRASHRGEATGFILSAFSLASILGVPLGLYFAATFFWQMCFYFIVVLAVIGILLCLWFLPNITKDKMQLNTNLSQNLKLMLWHYKDLLIQKKHILGLLFLAMISTSSFIIIPLIAPYAVSNLGLQESALKYIYFFGGILTFFMSRPVGKACDLYGAHKMYGIIALFSLIPVLVYTHMGPMPFGIIILVTSLFMALVSSRFIPTLTMLNTIPLPHDRIAYLSLVNATRTLAVAVGAMLAGMMTFINPLTHKMEGYYWNGWVSTLLILASFLVLKFIRIKDKTKN